MDSISLPLMAGDVAELRAENATLVEKVKGVDKRIAGATAVQVGSECLLEAPEPLIREV